METPHLELPFIHMPDSIQWITRNPVLFVLRGLPGSGKSFVARKLISVYPSSSLLSMDDYAIFREKNQIFDDWIMVKLQCVVKNNQSPIIIDSCNENVLLCEMFARVAASNGYFLFYVEPRSPWLNDLQICRQFTMHKSTQKNMEIMSMKLVEKPLARYYAWFLDRSECSKLQSVARTYWQQVLSLVGQTSIISKFYKGKIGMNYYSGKIHDPLHVTAKYMAKPDHDYSNHPTVQSAIGRMFQIRVIAIVFTPNATIALVHLPSDVLQPLSFNATVKPISLWQGEDNEKVSTTLESEAPLRPMGSRAHVTLGVLNQVKPSEAGRDVLRLLDYLVTQNVNEQPPQLLAADAEKNVLAYENGHIVFQFCQPQLFYTIFGAYF